MDSVFWLRLGLSFAVGGAWVALTAFAAERYGSRLGGLIGGLPSTAAVSLLFIGITQTPQAASEATTVMPLAQAFNGIVVIVYLLVVKRGLVSGLLGAVFVWFSLAGLVLASGLRNFAFSVASWILLAAGCILLVEKKIKIVSWPARLAPAAPSRVVFRALVGGSVIAGAVLLGKLGGPMLGGIFATFPAMFLSTLVMTYRAGGPEFSRAVGKALLVSGTINVALYAIVVRFLYPRAGLAVGTFLGFVFASGISLLTYQFMKKWPS